MSSEIILHCENLKLSIGGRNPNKATIHLDAIDQYFNDRISESEIGKCLLEIRLVEMQR